MSVLYLCDGKRCASCSEECMHTSQKEHAVNFKKDASGNYWEMSKEIVTYCMIYECEDCPRYGDDCDGDDNG